MIVNRSPVVSVLMTAYNRSAFIGEAIESVLESNYQFFELIIVDDASIDDTVAIAQAYAAKDDRIKVFINEKNIGDYHNRNQAAAYACGVYLKYLDSDDTLLAKGLQYCVETMEANEDADWAMMYEHGNIKERVYEPLEAIQKHFFETPFLKVGPGGTIIKADFFKKLGGYPTAYGPANDMYFNLKAACSGKTLLLNNYFLFIRKHGGQEGRNMYGYLYNNYSYLNDALQQLNLPLSAAQKQWLSLKLRRRFAVNVSKFFFRTFNFKKTKYAWHAADFSAAKYIQGILYFKKHP